jgi:hypothetical protein
MTDHPTDGLLRSYLDHELPGPDQEKIRLHLAGCAPCREQVEVLQQRAVQVSARLSALSPQPGETPRFQAARAQLENRISEKENTSMLSKLFTRRYRPAWVTLAVIALLAVALAFPPVQAIANSFLGLFRVQQVSVIQVNPGDLPNQLGRSSQLESMISKDVKFEEKAEAYTVADSAEASQHAGFPVRLPTGVEGNQVLKVQPGSQATMKVDLASVRLLLDEIGRSDIHLPDELDGAQITVGFSTGVLAQWGECEASPEAYRESGYDPDSQAIPQLPKCTALMEMPSPTIEAPAGLNVEQIGQAFLQVMGMSSEEAAQFAKNVDWTTTLVIPIPRYETNYQEVPVDGVTGTLIQRSSGLPRQYMLVWIKDGILYTLTGPGDASTALQIAESLQ